MKQIVISSLYLIILFCLSTFVFDPAYLYYEIWWLDIPMHVLGGFGVASLANAILSYNGKTVSYWKLFLVYIVVAVIWELYEYIHDVVTYTPWRGLGDTVKDLVNGFIGMNIAYLFVRK